MDLDPVRVFDGSGTPAGKRLRALVLLLSRRRAVALGNWVFLPVRAPLDPPLLVHELVHCGQFQRWGALRYFTRGAWEQLRFLLHRSFRLGSNPYSYRSRPEGASLAGMEQQAQMVEDSMRRERLRAP